MTDLDSQFENLTRLLEEAVILVDSNGMVVRANALAYELLGSNIDGKSLDNFLRHPDFFSALKRAFEENVKSELNYTRMRQIRRDFILRLVPFDDNHVVLVILDVTMIKSIERIQSEFVANVSHELRTPLTALLGFIETLQDQAQDDAQAQARFLPIMQSEAERMQRLIDRLLSLSRVEADEHRTPREKVSLQAVLDEIINSHANTEQDFVLDMKDWPPHRPPPIVAGAHDELLEVFHNLIENALRHGYQNTPIIIKIGEGFGYDQKKRPDLVRVQIINQSDTIAAQHLMRLTERFYRVDKGRSRKMGGTGLGLAIVKHIVNRHRGWLRITSTNNETCIGVTLPVHAEILPE